MNHDEAKLKRYKQLGVITAIVLAAAALALILGMRVAHVPDRNETPSAEQLFEDASQMPRARILYGMQPFEDALQAPPPPR